MNSNMMTFWGSRNVYDDRQYGDDSDSEDDEQNALRQRGKLMTITEESSQELIFHQTSQDSHHVHITEYGEEEKGEEDDDDPLNENEQAQLRNYNLHHNVEAEEPISDHDEEGTHNDFHSSALHTSFGLQAEDLELNNSMTSPAGGKYRTVSVFGGVFAMPPDPVDSDSCSLSSASDGFSSDEDYSPPPPMRSPEPRNTRGRIATTTTTSPSIARQTTPNRTTTTPRVVSPPLTSSLPPTATKESATDALSPAANASITSPRSGVPAAIGDNSMARALDAFDQTDSLISKLLQELESSPFHAVAPEGVEEAITALQASKQTIQSALYLEDFVISC